MSTSKTQIRLRSAKHLGSRPAHMHSTEHYRMPSQWFGNKGKGHCITEPPPPTIFGEHVRGKGHLFYFRDHANNGTSIPVRHHNYSSQQHLTMHVSMFVKFLMSPKTKHAISSSKAYRASMVI